MGNTKPLCADGPRRYPPLPMALHVLPSALRQPPERPAARRNTVQRGLDICPRMGQGSAAGVPWAKTLERAPWEDWGEGERLEP